MSQLQPNDLRVSKRRARRNLSATLQQDHADSVFQHLTEMVGFKSKRNVACYIASDGELNLENTMTWLCQTGHNVLIPFVQKQEMSFAKYNGADALVEGRWGLSEPIDKRPAELRTGDVILAPLVAFDESGARLGRGGGYYDRFMVSHSDCVFIGVAHELQKVEPFQPHSWDRRLDALVTEKHVRVFNHVGHQFSYD